MDPNTPPNQPQDQNKPDATPKQSIVARVQQAQNVLVTVKSDPSVDELAATIGMTLLLNKLGKHATAVFSGAVPSTLEFLKPEDTLETNTDSLRDFIVSLDKSKADKLRYKVEENVVKIFITPYRTSITQDDLEFTQGDFNVDVVLALGVTKREELDQAIMAHGRILHDATVASITAGQDYSELGQLNWQEAAASSLSEMLVSISEAFGGGLIDEQIATAFLTGIVSETERFSNTKTSPKVMTMAAQLMAAGANQQLIANELDKAIEVDLKPPAAAANTESKPDGAPDINISEDGSLTIAHSEPEPPKPEEQPKPEEPPAELPELAPAEPEPLTKLTPPSEHKTTDFLSSVPEIQPESFNPLVASEPEPPKSEDESAPDQGPKFEQPKPEEPARQDAEPEPPKPSPPEEHDQNGNIHIDPEGNLTQRVAVEPRHRVIQPLPPEEPGQNKPQLPETPAVQPGFEPPKPDDNDTSKLPPLPELDMTPSSPIQDDTTLQQIEESVNSPHVQEKPAEEGVDSARDAVMSALNQNEFDPSGAPRTDLNAMPLGAPPESTSFDSYRLADSTSEAARPVNDVSGNLPDSSSFQLPDSVPSEPAPDIRTQSPGGMPLHTLGEIVPEDGNSIPPPPVPPPMTSL